MWSTSNMPEYPAIHASAQHTHYYAPKRTPKRPGSNLLCYPQNRTCNAHSKRETRIN